MIPLSLKVSHALPVATLAKKAAAQLTKLMQSQKGAIFTYAWEPSGTKCAISVICGGTFIIQVYLSILETEMTAQGTIMDSLGTQAEKEKETVQKIERLMSELVSKAKK
jgi:hypothetical protein